MSNVDTGKASQNALENLHGKLAVAYTAMVDSVTNKVVQAKEDNEAIVIDKDELALLKQAQAFVKENGIEVDLSKSSGGKSLNKAISRNIENAKLGH